MGITGLIPFLEKASRKINIKEFKGETVAIDTYCWLHKGIFGCADKLSRGEDTDMYIQFCLKYAFLLLSHNIKPILVFDGRHLPAKAKTEMKRKENRQNARKRGAELLRLGKIEEAKSYLRRCIDVTHEMALKLIKECRKRNIDCIVAPYEADAQLAYLNKIGIANLIITEDSDLVLFGSKNIIFKFDMNGDGLLIETKNLHLAFGCTPEKFTFTKFRYMCILSGCDYLESLPGIGLAKAFKFFSRTEENDVKKSLKRLSSNLNLKSLVVSDEYIENFLKADATFKYMFVYDPFKRTMVRLNEILDSDDINEELCSNAGIKIDDKIAFDLALGNLDPFTLKKLDNWNPDINNTELENDTKDWGKIKKAKHKSIWNSNYDTYEPKKPTENNRSAFEFKKLDFYTQSEPISTRNTEMDILSMYSMKKSNSLNSITDKSLPNKSDIEAEENGMLESKNVEKLNHNPFLINSTATISQKTYKPSSFLERINSTSSNENNFTRNYNKIFKEKQRVVSRFFSTNISKIKTVEDEAKTNTISPEIEKNEYLENLVNEIKSSQEKDIIEKNLLYFSSPEDKLKNNEKILSSTESELCIENNFENNRKNDEDIECEDNSLKQFEFKKTNAFIISDDDEDEPIDKIKSKYKSAVKVRRIGLSKFNASKSSTQSKLDMFGFQKRPRLK